MTQERKPRVARIRPAGENHQVVTVLTEGHGTDNYQRRPCRTCPWRKDAVGEFPAEAFRHSAGTCKDMSMTTFACHSAGGDNPQTCAGFLLSTGADHNMQVRLQRIRRGALEEVNADGLEMFPNYREMAEANGVDPADPVLDGCL